MAEVPAPAEASSSSGATHSPAEILAQKIKAECDKTNEKIDEIVKAGTISDDEPSLKWFTRVCYSNPLITITMPITDAVFFTHSFEKHGTEALNLIKSETLGHEEKQALLEKLEGMRRNIISFIEDQIKANTRMLALAVLVMTKMRRMYDRSQNPLNQSERAFVKDVYMVLKNFAMTGMNTIKDGQKNGDWGLSIKPPSPYYLREIENQYKVDHNSMKVHDVVHALQLACAAGIMYERVHSLFGLSSRMITDKKSKQQVEDAQTLLTRINNTFSPIAKKDERINAYVRDVCEGSTMIEDEIYEILDEISLKKQKVDNEMRGVKEPSNPRDFIADAALEKSQANFKYIDNKD